MLLEVIGRVKQLPEHTMHVLRRPFFDHLCTSVAIEGLLEELSAFPPCLVIWKTRQEPTPAHTGRERVDEPVIAA
jgi:hypothetical protein